MINLCTKNKWPITDLRTIKTHELKNFGVFRDQLHLWHKKNYDYYETVAKLLKNEIRKK